MLSDRSPTDKPPSQDELLGELVPPPSQRRGLMIRVAAGIGALVLVIVGVAGIILPLLPGWPFLVLALPLIGLCSETTRRLANRIDKRLPLRLRLLLRRKRRKRR